MVGSGAPASYIEVATTGAPNRLAMAVSSGSWSSPVTISALAPISSSERARSSSTRWSMPVVAMSRQ